MHCPVHNHTELELVGWLPPPGFDPRLKRYRCPKCPHSWYIVQRLTEHQAILSKP